MSMRDMDVALLNVIVSMLPEEEVTPAVNSTRNVETKKTTKKGGTKK